LCFQINLKALNPKMQVCGTSLFLLCHVYCFFWVIFFLLKCVIASFYIVGLFFTAYDIVIGSFRKFFLLGNVPSNHWCIIGCEYTSVPFLLKITNWQPVWRVQACFTTQRSFLPSPLGVNKVGCIKLSGPAQN